MSIVDIHIIQSLAPNNVNRDETGAPKTCVFGGVLRRRVSSQSWKRAIRRYFGDVLVNGGRGLTENHLGIRTRRIPEQVAGLLAERGRDHDETVTRVLNMKGFKGDEKQSSTLVFLTREEMQSIADAVDANWDLLGKDKLSDADLKKIEFTLGQGRALDLALFGRMLADLPHENIDAACRVAHAISTHRADTEIDFFTAVDDLKTRDEDAGAGMMGDLEFSSCVLYRHLALDTEQLATNLAGDADLVAQGIRGLIEAAVRAVPGGRQTTFLAVEPPSLVLADVRGQAVGLANAFSKPVREQRDASLIDASIEALARHRGHVDAMFGTGDVTATFVCAAVDSDDDLGALSESRVASIDALIEGVLESVQ